MLPNRMADIITNEEQINQLNADNDRKTFTMIYKGKEDKNRKINVDFKQ